MIQYDLGVQKCLSMTAQEAADRWDISVRRVQRLCKEYRIEGVMNINRVWLIPKTANKPADGRYKVNKNQDGAD